MRFKLMNFCIVSAIAVISFVLVSFCQVNKDEAIFVKPKKVLIFSKTNGFRHGSISVGINAIKKLGEENNFLVDATEDSLAINSKNLKQYQVIIFLNTTGTILGKEGELALQEFMKKGKGFVGVHSASDCEFDWPWYGKMIGGYFVSHPAQQTAKLVVVNKEHIATKHLPAIWERKDEWYNFKDLNPDVNVLLKIDESSYTGGKNGDNHPMAWYQNYGGGRMFYTALGHTNESYSDPLFLQHLLGGITYAMGE
ncbi:Crp/Fnr family transcriptional regulator [Flavobacterium gilvum]|uniref:Crp/Fnr family transcriptional regulator n=2 Tax=Flavobacterium gilvum TaxID=1492737 RepID=A0AAC9I405_9FLAO|nr:Crp/Fnr family transcriptional regulator [Flavobacterium gilvum]